MQIMPGQSVGDMGVIQMEYKMEELVPIVGKLAEKYTAFESTSISYEKAKQLMAAVLYCIRELEQSDGSSVIAANGLPAQQAYETGFRCVEKKVKEALSIYNKILPDFDWYENLCLYDTFIKGIPEFFRRYDIHFQPQNTILTLDYPVLIDLSEYCGIDRIYLYIKCISLEREFLNAFSKDYVNHTLSKYNSHYRDMIDNICEVVYMNVVGHALAEKQLTEPDFVEKDYKIIQRVFAKKDIPEINKQVNNMLDKFIRQYCGYSIDLLKYLSSATDNIIVRLKNAAENNSLSEILSAEDAAWA